MSEEIFVNEGILGSKVLARNANRVQPLNQSVLRVSRIGILLVTKRALDLKAENEGPDESQNQFARAIDDI